jgi:hypothetical protein
MHEALAALGWDVTRQGLPCSQLELAYTLLTFSYVYLQGMRTLGMPLSRADEEATLHAWNVAGHVLGIREELMVHGMEQAQALFEAIQQRARSRPVQPDVRAGLGQALMNAMARSIGLPVFRRLPVPLTRWLVGAQAAGEVGIADRVSLPTRIVFAAGLVGSRTIDGLVQLVSPGFSLTRLFTRIVGYHFLTRFLLDQTRPLALPEALLGPLQRTIAGWGHDPRAPAWLNRLEDRFTAQGAWLGARPQATADAAAGMADASRQAGARP